MLDKFSTISFAYNALRRVGKYGLKSRGPNAANPLLPRKSWRSLAVSLGVNFMGIKHQTPKLLGEVIKADIHAAQAYEAIILITWETRVCRSNKTRWITKINIREKGEELEMPTNRAATTDSLFKAYSVL